MVNRIGTSTSAGCAGGVVVTTLLVVAVGISGASSAEEGGAGRSGCTWSERFRQDALTGEVAAFAEWDDGSGPAVYIGGTFDRVGELTLNRVARLDGSDLSPLTGPGGTGLSGGVNALAVFDDGSGPALYVGGLFSTAGGVTVNNVARWDGSSWSALTGPSGTGTSGWVSALAVHDDGSGPALYVGGSFTTAGGVTVNRVARWDGSSWSALAGPGSAGTSGDVLVLTVFDDGSGAALYAGGSFLLAGGVTVNRIARWDGSAWSPLTGPTGTGASDVVRALATHDDGSGEALVVGGHFTRAGGVVANNVARWNGGAWSALTGPGGTGTSSSVYALASHDDGSGQALYVGGFFTTAGGVTADRIARWDGSAWSAVSGPQGQGANGWGVRSVASVTVAGVPSLLMGGDFTVAGGVAATYLACWRDGVWSAPVPASGDGVDHEVEAIAVHDDGNGSALYAGGFFTTAGRTAAGRVARWDGASWAPLAGPVENGVNYHLYDLASYDDGNGPALYAGGAFNVAGGLPVGYVAKWDGAAWSALEGPAGNGASQVVHALAVFDDGSGPALYAGGGFGTAGGETVNYVARWDGVAWSALTGPGGTGVSSTVYALEVYDDGSGPALYVGGWFDAAGGVTVHGIARWDGASWSPLAGPGGTGVNGSVKALEVWDDGGGPALYVGGTFATAGGETANNIARWDGSDWSSLAAPGGVGVNAEVNALAAYGDGSGPALYAGGAFGTAGGVSVSRLARWDGAAWSGLRGPTGTGVEGPVFALHAWDDGLGPALYVGGDFDTAGGLPSRHIASWRCAQGALIFTDAFETGDATAWSFTVP